MTRYIAPTLLGSAGAALALAAPASSAPLLPAAVTDLDGVAVTPTTRLHARVLPRAARRQATRVACWDWNDSVSEPPTFAPAAAGGVAFQWSLPDATWEGAVGSALAQWNTALPGDQYLSVAGAVPAMSRPSKFADGTNYIGMAKLGGRTLAVTYTWTSRETGRIIENDVFFSTDVSWDVRPFRVEQVCPDGRAYDIEAISVHELGHVLGFDHISGVEPATMYPTAPAGETRKRTLTAGEAAAGAARDVGP